MHIYFDTPEFDAQLLRAMGYTFYQGADIGECLTTAYHIKPKDFDSWFSEWVTTAERVLENGEQSLSQASFESAKLSFLRASNYFRAAIFFLYGAPIDSRLIAAYDKHCETFKKATALFSFPVNEVQIPYEQTYLSGNFFHASHEKRPLVIINGGYDSTHQECYFAFGAAALNRGYHVLCFDGPGQGHALIKQELYMRHDWEHVISPVIDFIEKLEAVDLQKINMH